MIIFLRPGVLLAFLHPCGTFPALCSPWKCHCLRNCSKARLRYSPMTHWDLLSLTHLIKNIILLVISSINSINISISIEYQYIVYWGRSVLCQLNHLFSFASVLSMSKITIDGMLWSQEFCHKLWNGKQWFNRFFMNSWLDSSLLKWQ